MRRMCIGSGPANTTGQHAQGYIMGIPCGPDSTLRDETVILGPQSKVTGKTTSFV